MHDSDCAARRPFTLAEALAATGIVGLLSLILSPILLTVREGSRQVLAANLKELGAGMLAYVQDNDGRFPLAYAYNSATGMWEWTRYVTTPAGWPANYTPELTARDAATWANSTQPYHGDWQLLAFRGLPTVRGPANYENPRLPWENTSYTFNGLLHRYPLSRVAVPSQLPMLWTGLGRVQLEGFAFANPALRCTAQDPPFACTYTPNADPRGAAFTLSGPIWIRDGGGLFLSADATVRFVPLGGVTSADSGTDWRTDPYSSYDPNGRPNGVWNNGWHPFLFRPDYYFDL